MLRQLDVGGDGHGSEPVVSISEFGGLAKAHSRIRRPEPGFTNLGVEGLRSRQDRAVKIAQGDQHRHLGLSLTGLGYIDGSAIARCQRKRNGESDAEVLFLVPSLCLRIVRAYTKARVALVLRELHSISLLFELRLAGTEIKIVLPGGSEQRHGLRGLVEHQGGRGGS